MIWFGHSSQSRDGHGLVPESARVVGLLSWKTGAAGNVEARPAYLGPEYHFLNDLRCSEDECSPHGVSLWLQRTLAFMGANFILNIVNDHVQQKRAKEAIEPELRSQRQ